MGCFPSDTDSGTQVPFILLFFHLDKWLCSSAVSQRWGRNGGSRVGSFYVPRPGRRAHYFCSCSPGQNSATWPHLTQGRLRNVTESCASWEADTGCMHGRLAFSKLLHLCRSGLARGVAFRCWWPPGRWKSVDTSSSAPLYFTKQTVGNICHKNAWKNVAIVESWPGF